MSAVKKQTISVVVSSSIRTSAKEVRQALEALHLNIESLHVSNPYLEEPKVSDCTCIEDKTISNYCALHGDPTNPGGDCK